MASGLLRYFKQLLTMVGAKLSERTLHNIQMLVNYMMLGHWMKRSGYDFRIKVDNRRQVFDEVASLVKSDRVLYLEFGVFEGASMRYWSNALENPASLLHGFDSFEGLPEEFDSRYPKGWFDVGGRIPSIDDDRVTFHKGWFEETLPTYVVPDHDVLVITLDADLYSSTIFVLRQLHSYIVPGTFIYFDDLSRPDHEPRAFSDFIEETGLRFRPVIADRSLNYAFFECLQPSDESSGAQVGADSD